MMLAQIVSGALLGTLGAAGHLAVTRWRVGLLLHRRNVAAAVALYPCGLLVLGLAVYWACSRGPAAAWSSILSLVVARHWFLWRLAAS